MPQRVIDHRILELEIIKINIVQYALEIDKNLQLYRFFNAVIQEIWCLKLASTMLITVFEIYQKILAFYWMLSALKIFANFSW